MHVPCEVIDMVEEVQLFSLSPFKKEENFSVFCLQIFSYRELHILIFSLGLLFFFFSLSFFFFLSFFFSQWKTGLRFLGESLLELRNLGEWNYII